MLSKTLALLPRLESIKIYVQNIKVIVNLDGSEGQSLGAFLSKGITLKVYGDAKLIGPLLIGLGLPIEVAPHRSSTSDILNLASVAASSSDIIDYSN